MRLSELREDDILVHYVSGQIRAIGRVEGPAVDATREIDGVRREGQRVDVDYEVLETPIPFAEVVDELASLDIPNGPIGRDRQPKQGYLWRFSAEGLDILQQAREQPWPPWAARERPPRSWIFQGNPNKYDVRGAARTLPELSWMVKQYKNEIRPGDTVFLWESGSEGGVVARATVLTRPQVLPQEPAEAAFHRDATLQGDAELQVRLRVDARVDPPVGRAQLKAHPTLSGCAIMRMSQGTNFTLSDEEARSLAELVAGSLASGSINSTIERSATRTSVPPPIAPFDAIMGTLERAKLYYSEELVSHYLLALQSKRFVILTGVSGTGKTQLALEVARHFQAHITTQRPAAIPEDAVRVRVSPYMIDYRRMVVPSVLSARLAPQRVDGADRTTLRVSYGGREMDLACNKDPSRNVLQLLFRGDFFTWFTEHLDIGDDVYLRTVGAEEGQGHRLEILAPETTIQTEALDNRVVVAVRPDWTDSRGLLGYYNPIAGRYATTPFLRLLLRAREEQDRAERENRAAHPFFIVLDEMNLARVEQYFAEFLSAMESGEPLVLHDESAVEQGDTGADEGDAPLVPRSLAVPPNLFFTGTVNVDETTHMFSPKVLDRAFVIELNDVDLRGYGSRLRAQAALRLPGFKDLSRHGKPDAKDWDALDTALRDTVIALNDVLAGDNRHFGFRVANEVARFALLAAEQAPEHADILWAALDLAVLSKVLPKLNGTQQELEGLLGRLFAFAIDGAAGAASPADLSSWALRGGLLVRSAGEEERAALLPRTAAKLWRMQRRLQRQGFTSFIE
ncbi:EVE domain-containing protein [Sorangium sp. So ce118]